MAVSLNESYFDLKEKLLHLDCSIDIGDTRKYPVLHVA